MYINKKMRNVLFSNGGIIRGSGRRIKRTKRRGRRRRKQKGGFLPFIGPLIKMFT